MRPLNLVSVIEAAINSLLTAADAKNIQIHKVLNPHASLSTGDENRIQQIIWNLLSNAIKFTPKGGQVEVYLERINSYTQIKVSDTGNGISPDFLPYIFERFRQFDSSTTRNYGGLGLGLAIARHLVELHGGTIQAHSEGEGKGTTFIVQLPIKAALTQASTTELKSITIETEIQLSNDLLLEGLQILVVDDEADARQLLTTILEQSGATVTTAASVREAIEAIYQHKPDVLVSDIGMPSEDGYQLIKKVRNLEPLLGGNIPAVALTAYARSDERTKALLAGFQIHIPKQVESNELIAVVASVASRNSR